MDAVSYTHLDVYKRQYMSNAGVKAVKKLLEEKEVKYFHDLANAAVDAMEQDVLNAMSMFALE